MRMRSASAPSSPPEHRADMRMRFGDVVGGRRQAGADRPDRLVGDDRVAGGRSRRHRAGDLPA